MIDTIRLNIQDCKISNDANIIIEPSNFNNNDGILESNYPLFITDSGKIVSGKKAYLNTKYFNLTIKPKIQVDNPEIGNNKLNLLYAKKKKNNKVQSIELIKPGIIPYDCWNSKIYVSLSLPRYKNLNNIKPVSLNHLKSVLSDLELELKKIGIKCNIFESVLSRLDTFTNIETNHIFDYYIQVFDLLQLTRMKQVEWNQETFVWKNGEQQITIYDKVKEVLSKLNQKILSKNNIVRIENRLLKKRKILSSLGYTNINSLISNYNDLRQYHKSTIIDNVFKYSESDVEYLNLEFLKDTLQKFYYTKNRYWFRNFLTYAGYLTIIKYSSINAIMKAIDEMEMQGSESKKRVMKHRIEKQLNTISTGYNIIKSNHIDVTITNKQLYSELKTKFLKVA